VFEGIGTLSRERIGHSTCSLELCPAHVSCRDRGSGLFAHPYNGADPMALQPGATLGPYEILSLIGAGGMDEV
jgi:hypothetical protein